jgi:CheY-like chemotaxis protein
MYEASQRSAAERKRLLEAERAARAAAERMSEMKDQFLATLSHELRTPLSAILGWAQVLRRNAAKTEADVARGLEAIERNARMQTQLIGDLLDMSRIASGKVRLDVSRVDPATIVEGAIEAVRPSADNAGIVIDSVVTDDVGSVAGDAARLQQVVWNLLSNAVKFSSRGGRVCMRVYNDNGNVAIRVSDNGIGIKPEFLAHLFERFRQGDASTTRKYGGLGLGLSIVKNLVELHGGSVHAESEGEGRGATFTVLLPSALPRADGLPPHVPPLLESLGLDTLDLSGVRVLVVDDDNDSRELIGHVLADCAAHVVAAASAREALDLVEKLRPHVMVSDIGMPEVDGIDLLKRIRALGQERGGNTPAIALTAFARNEDRRRVLSAGYVEHLAKPVEAAKLVATVAAIAGRDRAD